MKSMLIKKGCRYLNVNLQGGDLPKDEGGHGVETRDPDHCRKGGERMNHKVFVSQNLN